jgi:hypothetical protein
VQADVGGCWDKGVTRIWPGVAPSLAINGAAFSDRAWEVGLPSIWVAPIRRAAADRHFDVNAVLREESLRLADCAYLLDTRGQ